MSPDATVPGPDDHEPDQRAVTGDGADAAGPDDGPLTDAADTGGVGPADIDVEDLLETLEQVTGQRDEYLESLQRLQAEFDNYRKRTMAATDERVASGLSRMAESLLPVLDACDAAVQAGEESVGPIGKQLLDVLAKEGLERIETLGRAFDPGVHQAVLHDGGDTDQPVVTAELRAGYVWRGKVLRAAMVKVSG